jgi:hypothetical protein
MSSTTSSTRELLPPHYEVRVGQRVAELSLFWQRRHDDALATLAGLVLIGRPVTVRHVLAAIEVLREHTDAGALRLARMLEARLVDRTDEKAPWYVEALPEDVTIRNKKKRYGCAYFIEQTTKLPCRNVGKFLVPGARGTFCALHAHRTASRIARKRKPKT